MKNLWRLPYSRKEYFPPSLLLGPIILWFYLLMNDLFFNRGKNSKWILILYLIQVPIFFYLFNIFLHNHKMDYLYVFKLFGLNWIFVIISDILATIFFGKQLKNYEENEGPFQNKSTSSIVFFIPVLILTLLTLIATTLFKVIF